jgi:hypothetical protein
MRVEGERCEAENDSQPEDVRFHLTHLEILSKTRPIRIRFHDSGIQLKT